MKKLFLFITIISFTFLSFAQEAEIVLPEVTTYIPGAVEQKLVITAEELEAAHFENLGEVLESAGIQMLSYGAYGLETKASIRGYTDETVRVVIDGICVNNAQYGTFDFTSINLSAVERIEIIRGGFTEGVEDEGSVGGVVYITMKKGALKNSLAAEVGLKTFFNAERPLDSVFQKLSFEGRFGENTFLMAGGSLNYAQNRYLYKVDKISSLCEGAFGSASTSGRWKSMENAPVLDGQANASLTHYLGDGNYFSFGDSFYGGHKSAPGPVNSANPGLQRDYNNSFSFSVWNPALANLFNLKNSVVWLCNNRFYQDKAGSENSTHYINTIKYTGTIDFTSLAGGRLQKMTGYSCDFTILNSTNDGQHIQFSAVIKDTTKFAVPGGWSFSLPLAAKICVNDDKINFAFVPKTGVAWQGEILGAFFDVYRMVQFPNMDDLFWEGGGWHGNPNLKPESGWGADLGMTVRGLSFAGQHEIKGGLTLFSNYYKDKIQWGSGTTQNLSSAFYLGLDFNIEASLFAGLWTLDLNGEYLYNRLLNKANKYTYGKRIMWTPDFVCNLTTALNFELVKISLTATYTGRRYTDNMNLYYLEPYLLMGLSVEGAEIGGRKTVIKFKPYLKLDNLLNWQYQSVENYSMPGISLTLGGRISFL